MAVRRHLVALLAMVSLIAGLTITSASSAGALPPSPTVPAAPTSLVAYRGNGSAEIAFTAGADGGASITNYEYSTDNGSTWSSSTAVISSPVTISGLTNGTTYAVRLRAVNVVGAGVASDPVSVTPTVLDAATWRGFDAAAANAWRSVTFGNGVFVAVASNGSNRVMSSSDGETWTAALAAAQSDWSSVTFGNGVFVAVASGGTSQVMTSSDGVNWAAHSAAAESGWSSVTYGNGVFVAVASNGENQVMTSTNGETWAAATATEENDWSSVTYGNGVFVAVASNGENQVMTSSDGVTWTATPAAAPSGWSSVTFGNGLFVAVSSNGTTRVMTSSDGFNWTPRAAAASNTWRSVSFGNGLFVAVASNGTNRVMTSSNGVQWRARTAAASNTWGAVTYGNGVVVALAANGAKRVMISSLVAAPDAPTSLVATAGVGSASIAFTPGADGGEAITKYQYRVGSGAWTDAVGTTSPITITGLSNYQTVLVRLRAVNVVGNGSVSVAVSVMPRLAGPGVTAATSAGSNGIVVTFNLDPLPGITPVAFQSVVAYEGGRAAGSCRTYAARTTCYIGGLARGTIYDLRVTAHIPEPGKAWHHTTFEGAPELVGTRR